MAEVLSSHGAYSCGLIFYVEPTTWSSVYRLSIMDTCCDIPVKRTLNYGSKAEMLRLMNMLSYDYRRGVV